MATPSTPNHRIALTHRDDLTSWHLDPSHEPLWIWPQSHVGDNQYVDFRHTFERGSDEQDISASLKISVDTNYAAWVNGQFIGAGQFPNYPDDKTYDELPVPADTLRPGTNVLAILAYYQGRGSSVYAPGAPGLLYQLEGRGALASSGGQAQCRLDPSYVSGELPLVTGQLSFTFEVDAREDDGWRELAYTPGPEWRALGRAEMGAPVTRRTVAARPLPKLGGGPMVEGQLYDQGWIHSTPKLSTDNVAQAMAAAELHTCSREQLLEADDEGYALHLRSNADEQTCGVYLIFDLGAEQVGHLDLELTADAGTIIDIGYGEHLVDGRVRTAINGRHFASRYTCRSGRQLFSHHFLRWAGRYLQLHIVGHPGTAIIHHVGLRPHTYRADAHGDFRCGSKRFEAIHQVARRTLELCMGEHYEDCPWREQALYANDMRNQALSGYQIFDVYNYAATSLSLLGQGLRADGFLNLTAPTAKERTIPSFTFVWVLAVADHLLHSGDYATSHRLYPTVRHILSTHLDQMEEGLLPLPKGTAYWHFYDWTPGMSGEGDDQPTDNGHPAFEAPLNLFFYLALRRGSWLAEHCGFPDDAAMFAHHTGSLQDAIDATFWSPDARLYLTRLNGTPGTTQFAELTQALALLAGLPGHADKEHLSRVLVDSNNRLIRPTLSQSIYKFEALMDADHRFARDVFNMIERDWGGMLDQGATSFWETVKGSADFKGAGSLCHGWSGIPVYHLHAHLLGIRPATPGYATFVAEPATSVVDSAHGGVTTPHGTITMSWTHNATGQAETHLSHPPGTRAVFTDGHGAL